MMMRSSSFPCSQSFKFNNEFSQTRKVSCRLPE